MLNLHETEVTPEAVAMAFELLLGRPPESDEIVTAFMAFPNVNALINEIRLSTEFRTINAGRENLWSEFPAISMDYMSCSIPVLSDFYQEQYRNFLARIGHDFVLHRKLWEFAFIEYQLTRSGSIFDGSRGLGFGCGQEPLPSLFASRGCTILATDAPSGLVNLDWTIGGQFSTSTEDLYKKHIIGLEEFQEKVAFRPCDMNNIDPDLKNFDFCWSACSLEHLGSIKTASIL